MRRLAVFNTKALSHPDHAAPNWMNSHAFNVLLWVVKELDENKGLIDNEDLFFLKPVEERLPVKVNLNSFGPILPPFHNVYQSFFPNSFPIFFPNF